MNLETMKFPNWQKIDPNEIAEPRFIPEFATGYNFIDLNTGNTLQSRGMIALGHGEYVSNTCFLLKIGQDTVPGYEELYDIEERSYLGDHKVTVSLRDMSIWMLGTEGLLREYLPRVMAVPLPDINVLPDSDLAQQCLFQMLSKWVFLERHGPYGNGPFGSPSGSRNCIRKVQLRKPSGNFEVLAELQNPFAKIYESEDWQFSKSYTEKKEGGVDSLNWMNNPYNPRQLFIPRR